MQTKTKYIADDGTEFDNERERLKHEALCKAVADALAPLGKRNRSNEGWVQHSPETVRRAGREFLRVCKMFNVVDTFDTDFHPRSAVGRAVSESGLTLNRAWERFASIDSQGREHNQPYYAINGPSPDQHEL